MGDFLERFAKMGQEKLTNILEQYDKNVDVQDEYETPGELYNKLCETYDVHPVLDVSATKHNRKCLDYFSKEQNSLRSLWRKDVWCNPPHTLTEKFVRKAYQEWLNNPINVMMLIPTNTMSSQFWHECIEDNAEYHAIKGRIRFLQHGKPSKNCSRNAYVCVIWRKK